MPLVPISRDLHARTKIRPLPSFHFTAGTAAVPVYGSEIFPMSQELPIVFMRDAGGFTPAAMLGLRPGQNLLIDQQGRWMATHIPAIWRRGPFRLAQVEGQDEGKMILCLDDSSDLLSETEGLALFDEAGQPTALIESASALLTQIERDIRGTRIICALLARLELLAPWKLDITQADGTTQRIADLFQVNEASIAGLPPEALVELRDAGALPLIYAHLLSLSKVSLLGRLAKLADERAQHQQALQKGNLNLDRTFGIVEDDPFLF